MREQERIAEVLSTWDEAIRTTDEVVKAKQKQKQALTRQVLTGKRRLPPFEVEWDRVVLGDLVEPVKDPTPKPQEPYVAVGVRSHGRGTFQRLVKRPEKVAMETLFRVAPGDLVANITFVWEGAIAVVRKEDAIGYVSHRFPTYRPNTRADIGYLRHLVVSQRFVWDLGLVSPGGAGRNRVMNKTDFLGIRLVVPGTEEQKAVVRVLDACNDEINILQEKRNTLRRQKKALMQKLLTGQVRVKV